MLDIPRIREDFPALQHGIYLHMAGIGMNARPVLEEVMDRWQFFFEQGPWLQSRRDERFLHKQRTREALARFFNVPTDTITMVNNVSTSVSLVVSGLPLTPGTRSSPAMRKTTRSGCRSTTSDANATAR